MSKGKLFLVPSFLDTEADIHSLPAEVLNSVSSIRTFVMETEKVGRAFLKKIGNPTPQSELNILLLNEHSKSADIQNYLDACEQGENIALISDAGLPCVADPGAWLVALAHKKNIEVVPLTGPSSIMLALMASGLNGQSFAFHGYLPIEKQERIKKLKELELESLRRKVTQIFIETPYRNRAMLEDLSQNLHPNTRLCVAAGLQSPRQFIATKLASAWKNQLPDIHKIPAVYLILA